LLSLITFLYFCLMVTQIELISPRLILRSVTPALIHELYTTKTKEEIIRYFGVDEKGYEHFKDMHEKGMETNRFSMFFFLLLDKQTNLPIGECGFHTLNTSHRRTELFYTLRHEADKRKGLMTEALHVVLKYGFTELDLHRVEALVGSSNTASIKLLQRFNFVKEGTMREDYVVNGKNQDSDCYSLLKWEWEKMQA
jgi:[ribosomal protein S5]-alanine N-acetyltransferase